MVWRKWCEIRDAWYGIRDTGYDGSSELLREYWLATWNLELVIWNLRPSRNKLKYFSKTKILFRLKPVVSFNNSNPSRIKHFPLEKLSGSIPPRFDPLTVLHIPYPESRIPYLISRIPHLVSHIPQYQGRRNN